MTIYEINQQLEDFIQENTDEETGELLNLEAFLDLQMERDTKIENTALQHKKLTAFANAIKAEIEKLTVRKKRIEKQADNILKLLDYALAGKSFATPKCEVKYRKSKALEIESEEQFISWAKQNRDDLLRYKEPEIAKSEVTRAIKSGEEIPGAQLVTRNNIGVE